MAASGMTHRVDPSGRVLVPSERRRIVASAEGVVALVHVLDPWRPLLLLTPAQHLDFLASLRAKTRPLGREAALVLARYEEETAWRRFDPAGRVTLPPDMLGEAGIHDTAVVAGTHRIALFSPEAWAARQAEREAILANLEYGVRLGMADVPVLEERG